MGPADSDSLSRVESYSGAESDPFPLRVRDCHPLRSAFQSVPLRYSGRKHRSYNPTGTSPGGLGWVRFRSPLLTESRFLSFPRGTEMFQFPPFATSSYGFTGRSFGHPGINARLTASPGFSQSSTPFFALWRLGIPHTPLVAWPH